MLDMDNAKTMQAGVAAGAAIALGTLAYKRNTTPPKVEEEKYQGAESYGDPPRVMTGLKDDLAAMSAKDMMKHLGTLLEVAKNKRNGLPDDDKKMLMERMIALTASLPETSKNRLKLTHTIVDTLWDSLQHPPLSYMGDKFQYRQADGSYNNVLQPDMGKAGAPYAKTCKVEKRMHGCQPDPGLLFDMLMARDDKTFKENPAGVSSMLFYHATIIIHDIFRTNRRDANISDTSSYLDLAPLYGSSVADQMAVRQGKRGLLWPDTFHEKRLIAQPPGVNVILVMYSRFHNYVADILFKINEKGRFPPPPAGTTDDEKAKWEKKLDEDLFQTARLVVGGLYVNISLHDYLRGLTNAHHSKTSWTLDPRIAIDKHFDGEGVPRGVGNQVSAEFNLMYRFHSTISKRDEKWLEDFLHKEVFPNVGKPLEKLNGRELIEGLLDFETNKVAAEPKNRVFGGLKRDATTGKFNDKEMVDILADSMKDPAGLFGARMVPKALRVVEILGILQARKWQLASLNEFRDFFGLKRHQTMEDINPDPEVASILRSLYDHPDMVELYPGLFLEEGKPAMNPGCGGCPPYTVGRGVFSDAVTLVRSDRFYTLDYTPATLTNWGMAEVQQDYKTMGGSMFYKLIQRAFPSWFPYNSASLMQPMFTKDANLKIAKELGTIAMFTDADPKPPPAVKILTGHSGIIEVLKDKQSFMVPWLKSLNDLFPGVKDYSGFMLGADGDANAEQRKLVMSVMYSPSDFKKTFMDAVAGYGKRFLAQETFKYKESGASPLRLIDIIRDVAIPVNAHVLADVFSLDLKTKTNPEGSLTMADLYKHLINVRIWGFNNNDPGMAWRRRAWAREGAEVLTKSTKSVIEGVSRDVSVKSVTGFLFSRRSMRPDWSEKGSLRAYGREVARQLLTQRTVDEVTDICWLTALAGVAVPVNVFAEVLGWFLDAKNAQHWAALQKLAAQNTAKADDEIRQYVLEAQRLTSGQRNLRISKTSKTVKTRSLAPPYDVVDIQLNPGDPVVCLFGPACKDPTVFPDPLSFKPGRPEKDYIHFGYGPHECLGREIALNYVIGLVKLCAGLKNLRRAPGAMGECKSISVNNERVYLNDNWAWLTFDPTTWKLHFEGEGEGVWDKPPEVADPDWDIETIKIEVARKYAAAAKAKADAEAKVGEDTAAAAKKAKEDADKAVAEAKAKEEAAKAKEEAAAAAAAKAKAEAEKARNEEAAAAAKAKHEAEEAAAKKAKEEAEKAAAEAKAKEEAAAVAASKAKMDAVQKAETNGGPEPPHGPSAEDLWRFGSAEAWP